jgi:hypothetical protein
MGLALPCLIRIVAACPRSRLIRVCASHNKTFPGREAFILIQPGRRDPCSQDWPGYAGSERPFWVSLAGASGRRSVLSGGTPGPVPRLRPGGRLPAEATPGPSVSPDPARQASEPQAPGQANAPRVPGQANAPRVPGLSRPGANGAIRWPRRRRCRQNFKGSKEAQEGRAVPRRPRAALEVARHSAAHRRLPTGSAPAPPAKLMNPGAR